MFVSVCIPVSYSETVWESGVKRVLLFLLKGYNFLQFCMTLRMKGDDFIFQSGAYLQNILIFDGFLMKLTSE